MYTPARSEPTACSTGMKIRGGRPSAAGAAAGRSPGVAPGSAPAGPPAGTATGGALAAGLAVFFGALLLYLATLAPTISWRNDGGDSAELTAAAYWFGVPHPTGYPLFMLLARPLALLPW